MIYPDKQFPMDENTYVFTWGKNKVGGFALIAIAVVIAPWDQFQEKPFVITHTLHSSSEPDIVQLQNATDNLEREEPVGYIQDANTLIVELLEQFKDNANVLINSADIFFYFPNKSLHWDVAHNLNCLRGSCSNLWWSIWSCTS